MGCDSQLLGRKLGAGNSGSVLFAGNCSKQTLRYEKSMQGEEILGKKLEIRQL